LLKSEEHASSTDFEYAARNDVKTIFTVTHELELVEYRKQAAKLHYGVTKKEALELAFQCSEEN
jgi:hypothetical protein